jgi:hypothetical protein
VNISRVLYYTIVRERVVTESELSITWTDADEESCNWPRDEPELLQRNDQSYPVEMSARQVTYDERSFKENCLQRNEGLIT